MWGAAFAMVDVDARQAKREVMRRTTMMKLTLEVLIPYL